MKNPNGYGSVVKLSGNRRRPYAVRKTVGWNEKGHPIYKTLGYCKTRKEGNILLAEYNKQPWDIDTAAMTLGELFESWKEKKMPLLSDSRGKGLASAWKRIDRYKDIKYKDIRFLHMQDSLDTAPTPSIKRLVVDLWKHLDKYAFELDIIGKRYSDTLRTVTVESKERSPFSPDEIRALFDIGDDMASLALAYIYTGMRAKELLDMDMSKINFEEGYLVSGSKTAAGKNRIIPIHPAIENIIKTYADRGYVSEYAYNTLSRKWSAWCDKHGFDHVLHECRHTTETELDRADANRKCIDLILGHKSSGTGQRIYNHKTIEELKDTIRLIPNYSCS
jgi:integrase